MWCMPPSAFFLRKPSIGLLSPKGYKSWWKEAKDYWGHLQNKNKKVEACPQTKNKRRLKLVLEGDRFYCISFFTFAKLSFSNIILTLLQFKKLDTIEPLQLFVCKFNRYWERNLEINDESLSLSDESYFSYHFFHLSSKLRLY